MSKAINTKFIGGILLIVGTSIGGGMLALPVSNAATGFGGSSLFLFVCWLLMTVGAFVILEVNLWLPAGTNMVSMAKATLGKPGQVFTWGTYLLLLYALLSAYISGGSDVFQSVVDLTGVHLPQWLCAILFVLIFGYVVIRGIKSVDYVNRGLMFSKLGVYLLLVVLIAPHIKLPNLQGGDAHYITGTIMVLVTSFGFATIVPSLRTYFKDDVKQLRRVIVLGSFIPLVCYIIWDAVIMGTVPRFGNGGLVPLMQSAHATSGLTVSLQDTVHSHLVTEFFRFFTSICMLTAFLGVSLCTYDFLADGLKMQKQGKQGLVVKAATFIPPLAVVLFYPGAFIHALAYAGILCVVLLVLLPVTMAWFGRYKMQLSGQYTVPGGRVLLAATALLGIVLIVLSFS